MFKKKSSKKDKTKSKSEEDVSWVVEGIVEYLQSPTWNAPVLNFVDSQCGSFTHSEECSLEHTEIHQKYKALVEKLLKAYTQELGISEKQFSSACSPSNRDIARLHRDFEYIWAADDFLIFKGLMASHNVTLQQEALEMMQPGFIASEKHKKFTSEDADTVTKMLKSSKVSISERKARQKQEEEDFRMAIEFSRLEMERLQSLADKEKQLLDQAIKLSLESSQADSHKNDSSHSGIAHPPAENPRFLERSVYLTSDIHKSDVSMLDGQLNQKSDVSTLDNEYHQTSDIHKSDIQKSDTHVSKTADFEHNGASNELTKPVIVSAASSIFAENSVEITATHSLSKADKKPRGAASSRSRNVQKPDTNASSLPPLKSATDISSAQAANAWLDQAMKGIIDSPKNSMLSNANDHSKFGGIDPEELAKRKAYLQEQRDKLLAHKRKQRNEELENFMENRKDESVHRVDPEEDKKLASRRAVVEKLKQEVVYKN